MICTAKPTLMCGGKQIELPIVRLFRTTQRSALDALNAHPLCDDVCEIVMVELERLLKMSGIQRLLKQVPHKATNNDSYTCR